MLKISVIGLCVAAGTLVATPALSDCSCAQRQVHQYLRTHYAHDAARATTRVAYRRSHARRHNVMMEEPYYDTGDEYYEVSGPNWHAQPGWWEWHPADDDSL